MVVADAVVWDHLFQFELWQYRIIKLTQIDCGADKTVAISNVTAHALHLGIASEGAVNAGSLVVATATG